METGNMRLARWAVSVVAAVAVVGLCGGCAQTASKVASNAGTSQTSSVAAKDSAAQPAATPAADAEQPDFQEEPEAPPIPDPFEKLNRAAFAFNDKLYFWVAKPVALGYNKLLPQTVRVGVRNFFSNLATPIRLVNCLLQAKWKGAGAEAARFGINTTAGVLGLADPAARKWNIRKQDEDLGQTLGKYGIGQGFYINWIFLGPSSPRDTVGLVGDSYLDPARYIIEDWEPRLGVKVYESENDLSLRVGDYEQLKKSALDPYVALKHAYIQNRQYRVEDKQQVTSPPLDSSPR